MAHKFNPGDKVTIKRTDWKSYWASAGGQWGDFDLKTYTIDEWDGDDVTPGYRLKEAGFRSLAGSGVFTEGWFDLASRVKGGGPGKGGEGKGEPGEGTPGEGQGEGGGQGEGDGKPEDGKGKDGEGKDGKDAKEDKDAKESKDGKGKDSKDMPKKQDKKEDKKDQKDKKDDKKDDKQDNPKVMIKDIPEGRVGRVVRFAKESPNYLLIVKLKKSADDEVLQFWPGYDQDGNLKSGPSFRTMEYKKNTNYFDTTEVELLPVDTTVTLCFNGKWNGEN
jgi:hypothetical protein